MMRPPWWSDALMIVSFVFAVGAAIVLISMGKPLGWVFLAVNALTSTTFLYSQWSRRKAEQLRQQRESLES